MSSFRKYVEKIQVSIISKRMPGALHEDQYTFLIILAQFSLERNVFQTRVVENIETGVLYSVTFFEIRAVYDICGKIR
jgi:hypothetical protein